MHVSCLLQAGFMSESDNAYLLLGADNGAGSASGVDLRLRSGDDGTVGSTAGADGLADLGDGIPLFRHDDVCF
jgi:hypothetical protein